ncbi:phosphotransferase [Paenibacillus glycinis]|uniref:Phosphotransferase n=1 Tax=Paenibacillus glycinis TaxID=2697035 RepID=A0ABW9XLD7_9BACL|nr:phosphotransferase [Paenibacillus glycinis]NBD23440.1 phosphotransferase [Paenibacillus glycinis]
MTERISDFAAIAGRYALRQPLRIELEETGMNNTTRMIYAGEERYVLRVYDNHRDREIAGTEHAILSELQRADLSFRVPAPVSNRDGATITEAPDGKLAAVFGYIAGQRPSPESGAHVEGLGRAAGELTLALAALNPDARLAPAYKPYYDFENTHAAMNEASVKTLCESSPKLAEQAAKAASLLETRRRLTALTERFKELPQQWIHGDIVFANALADGDAIAGLLDFEFCAVDARAMEPAVVLAEFPGEDDALAMNRMRRFCRGYGSKAGLGADEIRLLPDLMQLRLMDVWLHFAGRLAEGLDPERVWLRETERVSFACGWIDRHRRQLDVLFAAMAERQAAI